jgi:hypothetical protein
MKDVSSWRWPDHAGPVIIGQHVVWAFAGAAYSGQCAELWLEEGVAVVDGSDGNRWHFEIDTGEIVRRFPIPLPAPPAGPDAFVIAKG